MHRFYVPPGQSRPESGRVLLSEREAHHAMHVLRLRIGEQVVVLSGAGQRFLCQVEHLDRHGVSLKVLESLAAQGPGSKVTLLQALPKGQLMDSIIQKATELGAARVVPLITERVVSRFNVEEGRRKADKWRQVAIEAIKQSGSAWLPEVTQPLTLQEFLQQEEKPELPLIASLQEHSRHPRTVFLEFAAQHQRQPASLTVWIGPEGDFTPAETQLILDAGAKPIDLGPRVLRTETAAIYCLSVIQYELSVP